jgi:hypothetical protein
MWQRTCAKMWCPVLEQAGCQLIITAHQHHYRYDAPTNERPWAQIVGGGPEMGIVDGKKRPEKFPTVIEGEVLQGQLHVTIHNLLTGEIQQAFDFKARKLRRRRKG